jgi:hypothetical protein
MRDIAYRLDAASLEKDSEKGNGQREESFLNDIDIKRHRWEK